MKTALTKELTILAPFIDDHGADFLVQLISMCAPGVVTSLICRPISEADCGPAFRRRRDDFRRLKLKVFEYALPSLLPSKRETFHAKAILIDASAYYVGSSNLMASALQRSLEFGVIVRGKTARDLYVIIEALKAVSTPIDHSLW